MNPQFQQYIVAWFLWLASVVSGQTSTTSPLPSITPPPAPVSSPTTSPTPYILAVPATLSFASSNAAAQTITMSNNLSNPSYSVTPSIGGIVTTVVTTNTVKVTPIANGSTNLTISDGTKSAVVSVTVATGPLTVSYNSLTFQYATSTSKTVTVTDPGFAGTYTAIPTIGGIVNIGIVGSTITFTPNTAGTTTVTVSDGTLSQQISIVVGPGPLSVSPTTMNFSTLSGSQTITITDPGFSGTYLVSFNNPNIVSINTTGNTVLVSPIGNGSTTITVADTQNTASTTVTVAAAAPTPTPIWTAAAMPGASPVAVSGLPTPAAYTIAVQVNGQPSTTAGQQLIQFTGAWSFTAGEFGGSGTTNPSTGDGAHGYTSTGGGAQSLPTNQLNPSTNYYLFFTNTGTTVQWTQCTLSPVNCTQATATAISQAQTYTGTTGFLGEADATGTRAFASGTQAWNYAMFPVAMTLPQIQYQATLAVANPYPTPTATPTSGPTGTPPPGTTLSALYTGNTPFHHKVATLLNYGAAVCSSGVNGCTGASSTIATNWWAEGQLTNYMYDQIPMWTVTSSSTSYNVQCFVYGTCSIAGAATYFPSGSIAQCLQGSCNFDYHTVSIDTIYKHASTDLWGDCIIGQSGCPTSPQTANGCQLSGGVAYCAWGARYLFTGSGLSTDNSNPYEKANAAGYAYALFQDTGQEIYNAAYNGIPIAHAAGFVTSCEGAGSNGSGDTANDVYPSFAGVGTDAACGWVGGTTTPNTVYGSMIHLKTLPPSYSSASKECQAILTQWNVYGAYTVDNNGNQNQGYGVALLTQSYNAEALVGGVNLWDTVEADMVAKGEGSGSGMNFHSLNCINYIPNSSYLEIIHLNQGGTAALPPVGTP